MTDFRKNLLLSATALSLVFTATDALAAINVITAFNAGTTDASATTTNIETPIIQAIVANAGTEKQSSIYELADHGTHYGDGSSATIDMTTTTSIAESDYHFSKDGTPTVLHSATQDDGSGHLSKTLYAADNSALTGKTATDISAYATLADGKISRSGLTYTSDEGYDFALGTDTAADSANATAALSAANYQFTDALSNHVKLSDTGAYTLNDDNTVTAGNLDKSTYTYALADTTYVVDPSLNKLSDGSPQAENYFYKDGNGGEHIMSLDVNGDLVIPSEILTDPTAIANVAAAFAAYNADQTAYNTRNTNYNDDQAAFEAQVAKYNTAVGKFNELAAAYDGAYTAAYSATNDNWAAANTDYVAALQAYNTDKVAYPAAQESYTAYDSSLAKVIDTRAETAANKAINGIQGAVGDMNELIATGPLTLVDGILSKQNLIDENNTLAADLVDDTNSTHKFVSADEKQSIADSASALATLNGDENTAGSVKKIAKGYADAEKERALAAEQTLDGKITTEKNRAEGVEAQLDSKIIAEKERAEGIEAGLRTDVNHANNTLGNMENLTSDFGNLAAQNRSVAEHFAAVDARLSKIAGLAYGQPQPLTEPAAVAEVVYTNLDDGDDATVSDHLVSLNNAIGNRSALGSKNAAVNTGTQTDLVTGLQAAGDAIGDTDFAGTNYIADAEDLSAAVRDLDAALKFDHDSNNARFAAIDNRIDGLHREMERGLAADAALAGLIPLNGEYKTQLSMAMGGYKSNQAAALGAFHYLKENIILNAGVAYGGSSSTAYKVGVTFGF